MRNMGLNGRMCLDSEVGKKVQNKPVSLYPCHGQGGNQVRLQQSASDSQSCPPRHCPFNY